MVIKHIFFDIGGVLLEIDHVRSLQYWSDCTDLSIDVIKDHFPHDINGQYEISKLTDHEFFRAVKDALPQPNCLKEDDFWRGWNKLIERKRKLSNYCQYLKILTKYICSLILIQNILNMKWKKGSVFRIMCTKHFIPLTWAAENRMKRFI